MCQFCTALTCLGVRRARSSHLEAESRAILDPVAASQWAARQRFGRAVKVSQGAPRHMAAGEHTVAAAAKNCIAMAPTSWRSIEGGSSARPAAYDFLGVLISTVCKVPVTLNPSIPLHAQTTRWLSETGRVRWACPHVGRGHTWYPPLFRWRFLGHLWLWSTIICVHGPHQKMRAPLRFWVAG